MKPSKVNKLHKSKANCKWCFNLVTEKQIEEYDGCCCLSHKKSMEEVTASIKTLREYCDNHNCKTCIVKGKIHCKHPESNEVVATYDCPAPFLWSEYNS